MALRLGTVLHGHTYNYRLVKQLGDKTVFNSLFKAEILPGVESNLPKNPWAAVKTADVNDREQMDCLVKEYNYYKRPSIASFKYIRKMYDTINDQSKWTVQEPFCLALEWMDSTLAEIPSETYIKSPVLVANILKAVLETIAQLEKEHLVYSDFKPLNIFISGFDSRSPVVKIGDLGLMGEEGQNPRWVQSQTFRAPEVWTGIRCYAKADVFSAGALVLHWLDNELLGDHDMKKPFHPMTWCLGKIMRFHPNGSMTPPPPADADVYIKQCFEWAQKLIGAPSRDNPNEAMLQTLPYDLWAEYALDGGVPQVVLDIVPLLTNPDPMKRPSALQVLASHEYQALQNAAASYTF